MSLAEQILRKLLVPEKEYEQHYVDLEMGVFDCRVDLTTEEIAYCKAMRLIDSQAPPKRNADDERRFRRLDADVPAPPLEGGDWGFELAEDLDNGDVTEPGGLTDGAER